MANDTPITIWLPLLLHTNSPGIDAKENAMPRGVTHTGIPQVASDTSGNRALVAASHDGGYVAVSWPAARQYAVYRQGASAWQE